MNKSERKTAIKDGLLRYVRAFHDTVIFLNCCFRTRALKMEIFRLIQNAKYFLSFTCIDIISLSLSLFFL